METFEIKGSFDTNIVFSLTYSHPHEETFTVELHCRKLAYSTSGYCSYNALEELYKQLETSLQNNTTPVHFEMTYNGAAFSLIPDGLGKYMVQVRVDDVNPDTNDITLSYQFDTDQTFLRGSLEQIKKLLENISGE